MKSFTFALFIPKLSLFDKILWAVSTALLSVLYFFMPEKNPVSLAASVIGVSSLIFTAKGHVSGPLLSVVFALLYSAVSFKMRYYGEMITYLFMTAPSSFLSAVAWFKNPSAQGKSEVRIAHLTPKKFFAAAGISSLATVVFYFILRALNTANLEISTFSITTSMLSSVLIMMRVPYYALSYAVNDIVLIAMWILASIQDKSNFPMVLNFVIFLANDINGFFSWKKIRNRQEQRGEITENS